MGRGEHGHSHGHSHSNNHKQGHDDHHHHGHSHGGAGGGSSKFCGCCAFSNASRLSCMVFLTFSFFIVEVVVGQITNSISMTTDSFHMLSDVLALLIGLASVILSKRKTNKNTFGWVRAEILGALINSVFLLSLCFSIFIEAIERFFHQEELKETKLLLVVGGIGLAINLIGLFIFGHGHSHELPHIDEDEDEELEILNATGNNDTTHNSSLLSSNRTGDLERDAGDVSPENSSLIERKSLPNGQSSSSPAHSPTVKISSKDPKKKAKKQRCLILSSEANMNMRAVFLHVMADALGSVIVIISALLNIYHEKIGIPKRFAVHIDPTLSLLLVALILVSTIPLVKESALILLQTVPNNIKIEKIKEDLINEIPGIISVHEIHIWKLSANKIIATAHITCESSNQYMDIAIKVKKFFHKRKIHSTTIQPEFRDHMDDILDERCKLECQKACNANKCCAEDKAELKTCCSAEPAVNQQTTELNADTLLTPAVAVAAAAAAATTSATITTTINETSSDKNKVLQVQIPAAVTDN